jgi:hypothetical protein
MKQWFCTVLPISKLCIVLWTYQLFYTISTWRIVVGVLGIHHVTMYNCPNHTPMFLQYSVWCSWLFWMLCIILWNYILFQPTRTFKNSRHKHLLEGCIQVSWSCFFASMMHCHSYWLLWLMSRVIGTASTSVWLSNQINGLTKQWIVSVRWCSVYSKPYSARRAAAPDLASINV